MMLWQCAKPAAKRFFPLPDEVFSLGLSSGALAVYSCLLFCEDCKTYQCWPSYRSIGEAVRMSVNTVRKYVTELESQELIVTEPTSISHKRWPQSATALCAIPSCQFKIRWTSTTNTRSGGWRKPWNGCVSAKSWRLSRSILPDSP